MKMCRSLGRAQAVDQAEAQRGRAPPRRSPGADARRPRPPFLSERRSYSPAFAQHGAVSGRRGEADRGAVLVDRRQQNASGGAASSSSEAAPTCMGKQRQAAEPEGEGKRRAAAKDVIVLFGLEHMGREAVAYRQEIAMKMHGALGRSGGARGKGDQADDRRCALSKAENSYRASRPWRGRSQPNRARRSGTSRSCLKHGRKPSCAATSSSLQAARRRAQARSPPSPR